MDIGKIAAAAVIAAICAVAIRKLVPEIAMILALTAAVSILLSCTAALSDVFSVLQKIGQTGGISQALVEPVTKIVGISIITRITAEICRDAKESGLASVVETAGAILSLFAVLPLMLSVLTLISQLL